MRTCRASAARLHAAGLRLVQGEVSKHAAQPREGEERAGWYMESMQSTQSMCDERGRLYQIRLCTLILE